MLGRNIIQRLHIAGIVILAASHFGVDTAVAQSQSCIQLERQLASVSSGNRARSSSKFRSYDRAVKEQRRQIQKTRRIAVRAGCNPSSRIAIGGCSRYVTSLKKMQANLSKLTRTRNSLRSGAPNASAQRKAILRKMRRLRCGEETVFASREPAQKDRRRSLIEKLFGVRTYGEDGRQNGFDLTPGGDRSGTFRTMCVRTCDGYYFPISFSTVPRQFGFDEQRCQQMCPGTETQLYFHAMPSEDAEQMISYRTDEPYAQQSFAFAYRKSVQSECSCKFAQAGLNALAGEEDREGNSGEIGSSSHSKIGTPTRRADRDLDVETARNLAGGFTKDALANLARKPESKDDRMASLAERIENNQIRIVGPEFFPVQ